MAFTHYIHGFEPLLSPGKAITRLQWAAAFGITWGSKLHQAATLCAPSK